MTTLEDKLIEVWPAFPLVMDDDSDPHSVAWFGMSYRQWLIGQAIAGRLANGSSVDRALGDAFQLADMACARLEQEQNDMRPKKEVLTK